MKEEEYTGAMADYKITGDAYFTDEKGVKGESLEIGSVHKFPVEVGEIFVEAGVAEEVKETPDVKPEADEDVKADETGADVVGDTDETPTQYKVTAPIIIKDGSGNIQGSYRPDQIVTFPKSVGDIHVAEGRAEEVEA